ncbi:MAG: hypothetical protein GX187_03385 [Clostridiaceae bacterium]|nr:hypothetical protein [Clostridiaceae bacterium]
MKKFVIVMVSIFILFIFIMMNYLLWDKENLMEQRDNDRIEQDWLRGQNRTLQATVEELEQAIRKLQDEKEEQQNKIIDLENKLREALERENSSIKDIQEKNQAIAHYKRFMEEEVKNVAVKWFSDISNRKYEESFEYLYKNFTLQGNKYDKKNYIELVKGFETIYILPDKDSEVKPFAVIQDEGSAYEVYTRIKALISLKSGNIEGIGDIFQNGVNTLEVVFLYDIDLERWIIKSIEVIL